MTETATYQANNLQDLIVEVKQHGMDVTTDSVMRMQDILGPRRGGRICAPCRGRRKGLLWQSEK